MRSPRFAILCWLLLCAAALAHAQIFGTLRGDVQDPQTKMIPGAKVTLKATGSAYHLETQTDRVGQFTLTAVPAGAYSA